MKRELLFIVFMMMLGAVLGIAFAFFTTNLSNAFVNLFNAFDPKLLLTLEEKTDLEFLTGLSNNWFIKSISITGMVLLSGIVLSLLLLNLNPNLWRRSTLNKKGILKASGVVLSTIALPILVNYADSQKSIGISLIAGTGLLWLIAGEMGWAGDLLSWKMGIQGKGAKPHIAFIMGGAVGGVAFGLLSMNRWAIDNYQFLVVNALQRSNITYWGFTGFKLLGYGLMFMYTLSFGILAGFTTALSPSYQGIRRRLIKLIFPTLLFGIFIVTMAGAYYKYDLWKNLAEVLKVPEKASLSKTLVLLKPGRKEGGIILQEWPMEVRSNIRGSNMSIELTYENLEKLEGYLMRQENGSVLTYPAMEMLINGYNMLWDMRKSLHYQFRFSERVETLRLSMLERLHILPVAQENMEYLKRYADENRWYAVGKSALDIAKGFMHFGMIEEANIWLKKAQERRASVSGIIFEKKPLTDGKVYGSIKVNGNPPTNTKVAILRYRDSIDDEIGTVTLAYGLVDAEEVGQDGGFVFNNLGEGEYLIAMMTDKESIPYSVSPSKITVENIPGIIKLTTEVPALNLGDIYLVFK